MKKHGISIVLTALVCMPVFSAPLPPAGEEINSLISPLFLGGSPSVTSTASPQADATNPAASGGAQRAALDLSYAGIVHAASPAGYDGTVANLGLTYPTDGGVYTGSLHFLGTGTTLGLGTIGIANVSFAKDLYPNLDVGAGVGLVLGAGPSPSAGVGGNFDWGLGLNLGFLSFPGDIGFMKDFRWGMAFDNIGKGFSPANSPYAAYPAPFTPSIGAGFLLVRTNSLNLGLDTTLSAPSFGDLRLDVGSTFTINKSVSLHLATAVSLNNLIDPSAYPPRSFPISGGLTVSFTTSLPSSIKYLADKKWTRSEISPTVAVTPLANNEIALGAGVNMLLGQIDTTPPTISLDYPRPQWISPNNDGVQDSLDVPVKITDNQFVYGYAFRVFDASGKLVRQIDNPDYRPEAQGVQNVIDRLFSVKRGIPIPTLLVWDGKNQDNQVVPDGTYTFDVSATDENGNSATSPMQTVHVKVTPPSLTLVPITGDNLIFSPNGVGLKNTLNISQSGSVEQLWTGQILDAQRRIVRTETWKDASPAPWSWNGRNDAGHLAGDGVYSYRISAIDQAGNRTTGSIQNIIVNTTPTPVQIGIDPAAFSPGTASPIKTVTLTLGVPIRTGITSWSLAIENSRNQPVRTVSGTADVPQRYVFDGRGQGGNYLPEGQYHAVLSVAYANGHNPRATSPAIRIDTTPPTAHLAADYTVFSPNGDSPRELMVFHATASREIGWTGEVQSAEHTVVKSYKWVDTPPPTITWDGRGQDGRLEPDGTYTFALQSTDEAGNTGGSNTVAFTLDTQKKQVFLTSDFDAFSPNGARSSVHLLPDLKTVQGFVSYNFQIVNQIGTVMSTASGTTPPPASIAWNGKQPDGTPAPDGLYRGELTVNYTNGTSPRAVTGWIQLTTSLPSVSVSANRLLFSPNGDGHKDTVTFTQSSTNTDSTWTGTIQRADGESVKTWTWNGAVGNVIWNGTDNYGNIVKDGTYQYSVSTTDPAGNSATASVAGIVVDNRPTRAYVTVNRSGFSPNGDGVADTVTFSPLVTLADGIDSWTLAMVGSDGAVVRNFSGSGAPPASIVWDGKGDSGSITEGTYTGRLKVTYLKGDVDIATTPQFVLDNSPPEVRLKLSPVPFTPDNSGVGNVLSIGISVSSPAAVDTWSMKIADPTGQPFYEFSGDGKPASTLYWDGLSSSGELVQSASDYPYVLTVRDVLGNTRVVKGNIQVGILVMKQGDQYLIRVSSIHFAPYSSALVTRAQDPELYAQNSHVLDLIAQTLNRYSQYNVRLVGNAVSVYWYDPAKSAAEQKEVLLPLSAARAQTVKMALVAHGVPEWRMTTVGVGDANPIVPFSDSVNLWKDRRVDFVLVKP